MKLRTLKGIATRFIESLFSLTELLQCGAGSKCWGYVGTNAELLCVGFCNFVQCHIFVSYLSCYCFIKDVFNIRDTNTVAEKYSSFYRPISLFISWGKVSRLWVQSLKTAFYLLTLKYVCITLNTVLHVAMVLYPGLGVGWQGERIPWEAVWGYWPS
jgi:hypothetical protein